MKPLRRALRRQGGVAAIELALILLFFMGLLPFVLLFGRALLVYTALQKSVHDAARYMATMPLPQMGSIGTATQGVAFSRQMVVDAMAESWPHMEAARAMYLLDAARLRRRVGPLGLAAWRGQRWARARWRRST